MERRIDKITWRVGVIIGGLSAVITMVLPRVLSKLTPEGIKTIIDGWFL